MNVIVLSEITLIKELTEEIKSASGKITYFPLIEILPLPIVDEYILEDVNKIDKIIFQSKNSVRHSQKVWGSIAKNKNLTCLAVGKFTANEVEKNIGTPCVYPSNNYSSEGLLSISEMDAVSENNILIIKGKNGRNLIKDELVKRGAVVKTLDVYERKRRSFSISELNLDKAQVNYIVVLSKSSLDSFLDSLGNELDKYKLVFLVPEKRITKSLRVSGSIQVVVVEEIDSEISYLSAIKKHQKLLTAG